MGGEHEVDVVPGLRHPMVQSFDLVVGQEARCALYTVVIASEPGLSRHDKNVIRQALAATRRPVVVFLEADSPEGASAYCVTEGDPRAVAAAVAVVRSFASSSEPVQETVTVNGRALTVEVTGDGLSFGCRVG